jgi:hypothetical protein
MSITKPGFLFAAVLAAALLGGTADAQQPAPQPQPPRISLTSLTAQGFEIKAVSSAPSNFQVLFIQKGKDVYACFAGQLGANEPWKSDCYPME